MGAQLVQGGAVALGAVGADALALGAAAHPDHDRAVHDRVREVTDARQRRHREGVEAVRGVVVAHHPQDVAVALVPGVEQAAHLLVLLGLLGGAEDGVGLVDQQGRGLLGDGAEDCGGGGVDCDDGVVNGLGEDVEQA